MGAARSLLGRRPAAAVPADGELERGLRHPRPAHRLRPPGHSVAYDDNGNHTDAAESVSAGVDLKGDLDFATLSKAEHRGRLLFDREFGLAAGLSPSFKADSCPPATLAKRSAGPARVTST